MKINRIRKKAGLLLLLFISVLTLSFTEPKEWHSFESKECGFKIDFPGQAVHSTQPIQTAAGELKLDIFQLDISADTSNNNGIYLVNYSILPDSINSSRTEKMDAFFDGSVNGMATNVKGTVLSTKVISYNGYPGRIARVDMQGQAIITAKLILIKNKYYMIMTMTLPAKEPNIDITKFFDSFEAL